MAYSFSQWCLSKNKGDPAFFRNRPFRNEYTSVQLARNRRLVTSLIKDELHATLDSSDKTSYKALSLACGPGSDLLAVMDCFQSYCLMNNLENLRLEVTGVGLNPWPLYEYRAQRSAIVSQGPIQFFPEKFIFNVSMEDYVNHLIWTPVDEVRFDFIILSFAEVKTKLSFVGELLSGLLRDRDSRVLVIDNNIWQVRQLEKFDFQIVSNRRKSLFMAY